MTFVLDSSNFKMKSIFLKIAFLALLQCVSVSCTTRPIIGIMAQDFAGYQYLGNVVKHLGDTYIAASYVKGVESAGARVVPIMVGQTYDYYKHILYSINGVVAPGGDNDVAPGNSYYESFLTIIKIAEEMYDKGIHFPIMGLCWGFEALLTIYNNHQLMQTTCDGYRQHFRLHFEPKFTESLLFSQIDHQSYIRLKYFPITAHAHFMCTTPRNFTKSTVAKSWKITSTCVTSRGLKFIASAEHKKYPFIALQFHPEKPLFEWTEVLNMHHNGAAIQANRHFYDVLVKLARQNSNKFASIEEEKQALIYNHNPFYTRDIPAFAQIYVFK